MLKSIITRVTFVSLILVIGFCDEALPPRSDPDKIFQTNISASYILLPAANDVTVSMKFVNMFDETLAGQLGISGRVEITWTRFSYVKKIINLNSTNLNYARKYNSLTGELILDPGDSVVFSCAWHVMADSETQLRNQIFLLKRDSTCPQRFLANPETFLITGDVRVFRNTAPVPIGQTEFTFCLVTAWLPLPPRGCLPPVTDCSVPSP